MKVRPILFSGPMVRALLNGSKTQTRLVVKPQPQMVTDSAIKVWDGPSHALQHTLERIGRGCPYGQPGDRLWVRETHAPQADCWGSWERWTRGEGGLGPIIHYAADDKKSPFIERWRPSIHMPRWASRITLEVTGVRVERLQDISEADAMAEGIAYDPGEGGVFHVPGTAVCCDDSAIGSYQKLWESINGPGSWDANPWVWAVSFKRVEGGTALAEPAALPATSNCGECRNADSWGIPDQPVCNGCVSGSQWTPLNASSVNPNAAQQPAPVQEPAAWLPMDAAPKDGSLVLLLVEFEDHATEDGPGPHPTIGSNTSENDEGPDEWQFAGWNWEYDCYTQGVGTPVGWLPMTVLQLKEHQDTAAYLDDLAVDRFAAAMKAKMAKQRARGYGGWHDADACPTKRLQKMLCEHVGKGDPVDVGNIAMMLWTRKEPTKLQAQQLALVQKSECGRYAWVPVKPSTAMLIAGSHCQPGDYSAALVWEEMVACAARTDYLRPVDPPQAQQPASPPDRTCEHGCNGCDDCIDAETGDDK